MASKNQAGTPAVLPDQIPPFVLPMLSTGVLTSESLPPSLCNSIADFSPKQCKSLPADLHAEVDVRQGASEVAISRTFAGLSFGPPVDKVPHTQDDAGQKDDSSSVAVTPVLPKQEEVDNGIDIKPDDRVFNVRESLNAQSQSAEHLSALKKQIGDEKSIEAKNQEPKAEGKLPDLQKDDPPCAADVFEDSPDVAMESSAKHPPARKDSFSERPIFLGLTPSPT